MTIHLHLREAATAIVSAAKKDGATRLKFTTVLKSLTTHFGYRSIQAYDHVSKQSHQGACTPSLQPDNLSMVYLQGVLYSSYPYASDIVAFDNIVGHSTITEIEAQDPLFVELWTQLHSGVDFADYLSSLIRDLNEILDRESHLLVYSATELNGADCVKSFAGGCITPALDVYLRQEAYQNAHQGAFTEEFSSETYLDIIDDRIDSFIVQIIDDLDSTYDAFFQQSLAEMLCQRMSGE